MKKHLLSLVVVWVLLSLNVVIAQNPIPNGDFENWTGNTPDEWDTSNESILGAVFTTVTRETNSPLSGIYSAKIQSVTQNIIFVGPVTMPGILTLGDVVIDIANQTGTVTGGVPINGYPKLLKGYYKYQPTAGDSCILGIMLTKWNGLYQDTIAYAYKKFGANTSNWLEFNVPIIYETFTEPDSMNIMFVSSNIEAGVILGGSTLWVDNLSIEFSGVAVQDNSIDNKLYVSESADGTSINIHSSEIVQKADIFNLNGIQVSGISNISQSKTPIDIASLKSGIYIIRVIFANGSSQSVKFRKI